MCMGYANEIKAWVCDEARTQREAMMDAWGSAFEAMADELKARPDAAYRAPAFNMPADRASAPVSPLRLVTTK